MQASLEIPPREVQRRLGEDNPWWTAGNRDEPERGWPRRAYFAPFMRLLREREVHRLQRRPLVTTLTRAARGTDGKLEIDFVPTSLHAYTIARNLLRSAA